MTHGICDACDAKQAVTNAAAIDAIGPVVSSTDVCAPTRGAAPTSRVTVSSTTHGGSASARATFLGDGSASALRNRRALGSWRGDGRGGAPIHDERRAHRGRHRSTIPAPSGALDILLVNANGNDHTLGVRMVNLLLRKSGRSTHLVLSGPSRERSRRSRASPKAEDAGISVARIPSQIAAVREMARAFQAEPHRPRLVARRFRREGGHSAGRPRRGDRQKRRYLCGRSRI